MYDQQQYYHPLGEDISAGDLAYDYASHLMFDPSTYSVVGTELDFDATQYVNSSQYIDFFQHQQQHYQQQKHQDTHQHSNQPSQNSSLEDMLYPAQDYLSSSSTSSIGTAPGSLPNQVKWKKEKSFFCWMLICMLNATDVTSRFLRRSPTLLTPIY